MLPNLCGDRQSHPLQKHELLSGEYNPLDVELKLKAMEETIKQLRSDEEIRSFVLSEAEKYGKSFEWRGAKMSIREVGVKYDYSSTGDSEWAILDAQIKELSEKKKAREKFLQAVPASCTVSPETGEMILSTYQVKHDEYRCNTYQQVTPIIHSYCRGREVQNSQ